MRARTYMMIQKLPQNKHARVISIWTYSNFILSFCEGGACDPMVMISIPSKTALCVLEQDTFWHVASSPLRGQTSAVPLQFSMSCWTLLRTTLRTRGSLESSATCALISCTRCSVDRISWNIHRRNRRKTILIDWLIGLGINFRPFWPVTKLKLHT